VAKTVLSYGPNAITLQLVSFTLRSPDVTFICVTGCTSWHDVTHYRRATTGL